MTTETATKYILSMPFDAEFVPIINELAMQIGLNESVVLIKISLLMRRSNNVRDGKYWVYKTLEELHEVIPYFGTETIRRAVVSLKDQGYILIGNYNKRKGDHTQWFALEPDKCSSLLGVFVNAISETDQTETQNGERPDLREKQDSETQNGATLPESLNTKTMSTLSVAATPTTVIVEIVPEPEATSAIIAQLAPEAILPADSTLPTQMPFRSIIVATETEGEIVVGEVETNKTKSGRKRAAGVTPAECINPMKAAIMKAFGWSWKTAAKNEKGQVNAAAKQLCDCSFPVEQIPALHDYCAEKFQQFGPMALTTNQSEFRKEHKPKDSKPHPALADSKPVVPIGIRRIIERGLAAEYDINPLDYGYAS